MASPATGHPSFSVSDVMGQARSENFPVASRVLPRKTRPHLLAVYGFARLVDDIGDEAEGDRLAQLDWAERELERASLGTAVHPVFTMLAGTLGELDLPLEPFVDLIEANRRDQVVTRYATFDELTGYSMRSAAPVGRLVLLVLGCSTPARVARSDRVCVGLQLVEHLQDVAEDHAMGRIYLPTDDLAAAGCDPERLLDDEQRPALCATVAREVARARELLAEGGPLAASLPLRARLAVAAFSAGGAAALDAIERASYDVVAHRCRPRPSRLLLRWVSLLAAGGRNKP